jgi:hypothetical protein
MDLTLPSEQIVCQAVAAWRAAPRASMGKRPAIFLLGR